MTTHLRLFLYHFPSCLKKKRRTLNSTPLLFPFPRLHGSTIIHITDANTHTHTHTLKYTKTDISFSFCCRSTHTSHVNPHTYQSPDMGYVPNDSGCDITSVCDWEHYDSPEKVPKHPYIVGCY